MYVTARPIFAKVKQFALAHNPRKLVRLAIEKMA